MSVNDIFRIRSQKLKNGTERHYPEIQRHILWVYRYWAPLVSTDVGDEFTGPIMMEEHYHNIDLAIQAIKDYISEHYGSCDNDSESDVIKETLSYYKDNM